MTTRRKTKARCQPEDKLFLPYQAKWITDRSRLKIMEKSRQIGISWATAYGLVRAKSAKDARLDAWVSSRDDIQARLFLEDCKAMAAILNLGAQALGEVVIDPERKISAYILQFANGIRIHSMSSNPDAQAGKRGDRCLDEFALHPDPRKLYAIAYPGITWGGSMEIVSTHRGETNFFNQILKEIKNKGNPKKFSHHRVTLQDALDQGFLARLQEKLPADDERQDMDEATYFDYIRRGCPDDETFHQEYCCVPADEATAFLSYDLISGCEYAEGVAWETDLEDCKNPLDIGVDVGRVNDLTVIWILETYLGIRHTRRVICMKNESFSGQEERLWNLLRLPAVRRCCMDSTGLGMQLAERAKDRFGYKVEPVRFTGPIKEELAFPVRAAFEDKSLRIPSDAAIRSDLRGIKKEETAAGHIRFAGERTAEGHSDRFWALALALHAGSQPGSVFIPVPFKRGRRAAALQLRSNRSVLA